MNKTEEQKKKKKKKKKKKTTKIRMSSASVVIVALRVNVSDFWNNLHIRNVFSYSGKIRYDLRYQTFTQIQLFCNHIYL